MSYNNACRKYDQRSDSHFWLATVQLVLQADWQDVWHSPQALPDTGTLTQAVWIVLMCVIIDLLKMMMKNHSLLKIIADAEESY